MLHYLSEQRCKESLMKNRSLVKRCYVRIQTVLKRGDVYTVCAATNEPIHIGLAYIIQTKRFLKLYNICSNITTLYLVRAKRTL